ncbi:MAG TPA: carboxyltransferase domain-containing protein, partial [Vicinamibacterales bacterium]
MTDVRIVPAGDAALVVELPPSIDPETSARIIAIADAVRDRCGAAVRDVVIGYCTATLYFDPLVASPEWLEREVRQMTAAVTTLQPHVGGLVDVPVCYGGELGPDLADVAAFAGTTEDEVVAIHTKETYRVYVVGFIP